MKLTLMLFFGGWLLVSIAAHITGSHVGWLRRRDRWSLIPIWRFFVANAMRDEYFVVSSPTGSNPILAQRILPPPHSRAPWRWLYNPARLDAKAFSDVAYLVVSSKDEKARRILAATLSAWDGPPPPGQIGWTVLRKDNLHGDTRVVDTLP